MIGRSGGDLLCRSDEHLVAGGDGLPLRGIRDARIRAGGPGQGDGWTRWAICRSLLSSVSSAESVTIAVASDIASGSRSD